MEASEVAEKAKIILSKNEYLAEFAKKNGMNLDIAKALLERLMREPVVTESVEKFVFSDESPPELKSYYSGEEKGYSRGHESGFAKGTAVGVLGTILTVGALVGGILLKRD